jgi:hypothetical protein
VFFFVINFFDYLPNNLQQKLLNKFCLVLIKIKSNLIELSKHQTGLVLGGGGGRARILCDAICCSIGKCWFSSSSSSSSSDVIEFNSELDGEGDGGDRVSCSCSIVRKSCIDSFNAHSWDSNERSSCRRPN